MWAIQINSSFSLSLSAKVSNHFHVFSDDGYTNHQDFFLTSPHLANLSVEDSQIAYFRVKALMRILNGIMELNNQPKIVFRDYHIYYIEVYKDRWRNYSIHEDTELEFLELQNPFKECQSSSFEPMISNRSYTTDLFDLAYSEELVKEVLVLFSLVKLEPLYLLINTLKIVETIKFDINSNLDSGKLDKEFETVLGNDSKLFLHAYKFFTDTGSGKFSHFINTRDGSGIFARHGANTRKYEDEYGNQLPTISFVEIEKNIQILIYEWINYKLVKIKGYRYPLLKQESRVVELKDEDFNFDL